MDFMITAREIQKYFGKNHAVAGVNMGIQGGEIYGLVGPDGAGKTTTIRLLCGALKLDSGQVFIGPYDMTSEVEQGRELIGYLPQRFSLYEELTVQENLRFFAEVRGLKPADWNTRSHEILEFVGLLPFITRRAGQLSGGMKQKLGLAAALVHKPIVLLLDEPTTGVDPGTRQDFWQLIIRLVAEDRITVLVSTPYMDEAARCHRLGFMQEGHILVEGSPYQLCEQFEYQVLELHGSPIPLLRSVLLTDPDVYDAQMFGDRLHIHVLQDKAESLLERLPRNIERAGGQLSSLQSIFPELEDVFLALVDKK